MEAGVTKKSYSIWSLLVIVTLLAVWLAVPRAWNLPGVDNIQEEFFFLCHQVVLWCTVFVFIWLSLGRRRLVLWLCMGLLVLAWGPLCLWLMEAVIRDRYDGVVDQALHGSGLYDPYSTLYGTLHENLGYAR